MDEEEFLALVSVSDVKAVMAALKDDDELWDAETEDEYSIIAHAMHSGFDQLTKALVASEDFYVGRFEEDLLHTAIVLGQIDIAELFLSQGASPNKRDEEKTASLIVCLENEYFDLAEKLIKAGAEIDIRSEHGWTPLIWASVKGRKKAVEFLLANGANIHACNDDGWNAVTGAYFKKHTDLVDLLLSKGGIFGAKYAEAALLSAFDNGYVELVNTMLTEMGVSPNIADDQGVSLLAKAVAKGDWALTKLLIEKGAEVNVLSSDGLPLIAKLAKNGHNEMISLFLKRGADLNLASTKQNRTAMHLAACYNHVETISLLAQQGANINAQDGDGDSPLMEAAHREFNSACRCLLKLGANRELLNNNRKSARQLVRNNGPKYWSDFENQARYTLYCLLGRLEEDNDD